MTTEPQLLLEQLNKTVHDFKEAHAREIKADAEKRSDVILQETTNRINAAITPLQKSLDDINSKVSAVSLNGSGNGEDPNQREYRAAFNRFFRDGVDAGLSDLAVKAALTTQSKPDGGYLVPTEMETTIDRVLGTVSVLRNLSTVRQISTKTYTKLVNMGGSGTGWVGEEEARPETGTPTLQELEFNLMEIYAKPAATQTMLDDAVVDIEQWIADEVSISLAEQEGAAFITGNGVRRPRGILTYNNVANGSYSWGNIGFTVTGHASAFIAPTSSASPADCLIDLFYSLKSGYRNNATWLTSDAVLATIRKMKDGQGNYLWAPPQSSALTSTILEKPVQTDDNMPALGANVFPVAFADFRRAYLVVDRLGTRILRDPYSAKPYVQFYVTKRVGGGVQNFEAVKLLKCST
jgi:HK97 family phage major capsid protein